MKDVVFVTSNPHKAERYGKMFGFQLDHIAVELTEIQSVHMQEIVSHKAKQAYEKVGRPVLIEDIGFVCNALGTLPGPFIKFFVEQPEGMKILCTMLDGFEDRSAYVHVAICYFDGNDYTYFEQKNHGYVADHPRGNGGFGYDAIWCPDGYAGKTRAELSPDEEQATYEAGRPLKQIRRFLYE